MVPRATIIQRCPKCNWTFEAKKGDKLHPHCSTKKPKQSDVEEDIVEETYDCRNPECMNPVIVYYYRAKPSFYVG